MDRAYEAAIGKFGQPAIAANNLTIGNPDLPPPQGVMDVFARCAAIPDKQGYMLPASGSSKLLTAASAFRARKHKIDQMPITHLCALKGARIGLNNAIEALTDEGDLIALPAWFYPGCLNAVIMAYCKPVFYSVLPGSDFFTEVQRCFDHAKHDFGKYPRLLLTCPVGNPFCFALSRSDLKQAVDYLRPKKTPILSDEAYIYNPFPGEETVSLMQVPGGPEAGVSLVTFSKMFDVPSWRLAFAQGHLGMMEAIRRVDSAGQYGHSYAIEQAAIEAMSGEYDGFPAECGKNYGLRYQAVISGSADFDIEVLPAQAGMFAGLVLPAPWAALGSLETAARFLEHRGKRVNPGCIHGQEADGLLRLALVKDVSVVKEVTRDLCEFLLTDPEQYQVPPDAQSSYIA